MTRFVLAASLVLATAAPGFADDDAPDGRSLMEEGARMLLEGLMKEMEPAIEELEGFADQIEPRFREFWGEMGPALRDLMDEIEDWSAYHPPEILPNGDIILRKKTPQERQQEVAPEDEIET